MLVLHDLRSARASCVGSSLCADPAQPSRKATGEELDYLRYIAICRGCKTSCESSEPDTHSHKDYE